MSDFTYSTYLNLEQLLTSQHMRCLDDHPFVQEEMVFIITHQAFELWFHQTLFELDKLQQAFREDQLGSVLKALKRVQVIFGVCNQQFQVLDTLSPTAFAAFRTQLGNASGFQSVQFRELEFVLGMKHPGRLTQISSNDFGFNQLKKRYAEPTVWDAFLIYLHGLDYVIPAEQLDRDVTQPIQPSLEIQTILNRIYYNDPTTRHICEQLIDIDQLLQSWRQQHLLLVERLIGNKYGTHGTTLSYLRKTIRPHFPDLWQVREHFTYTELVN